MNQYVTGAIIKKLREEKKMTQLELAGKLCVSEKTVSKWENGKGYPDIAILEDIASSLGISVIELLAGNDIRNSNRSFNMARLKFYICPICGNVIWSTGDAECRFKKSRTKDIYYYCNKHGLYRTTIKKNKS